MSLAVLAVGELLVDFISTSVKERLTMEDRFQPFPGGSPANLAGNLSRLGINAGLAATVGQDDLGQFLGDYVAALGLDVRGLRQDERPTTTILLTRSLDVPKFEAYRAADAQILPEQLPTTILRELKIFHTTCFALSQYPARETILAAAAEVVENGGQVSIDTNYAHKIWPNREEAQQIVADYCALGALVKCSDVDWQRLYGLPLTDPAKATAFFHELGAKIVCLTLGAKGCYVSDGQTTVQLPVRPIVIVDTTGAGDAFWAGFLSGCLLEASIENCAKRGRALAELKLQQAGPLPSTVVIDDLL
ncbi:MAG: carbohydrate kinase [Bacteroidota bacterium]